MEVGADAQAFRKLMVVPGQPPDGIDESQVFGKRHAFAKSKVTVTGCQVVTHSAVFA